MARRFLQVGDDLMLDPAELAASPAALNHALHSANSTTNTAASAAGGGAVSTQVRHDGKSAGGAGGGDHLGTDNTKQRDLLASSDLNLTASDRTVTHHFAAPGGSGLHAVRRGSVVAEYLRSMKEKEASSSVDGSPLIIASDGASSISAAAHGDMPFVRVRAPRRLSFAPGTQLSDTATLQRRASSRGVSGFVSAADHGGDGISASLSHTASAANLSSGNGFFDAHRHLIANTSTNSSSSANSGSPPSDPAAHFKRPSGTFRFSTGRYGLEFAECLYGPYAERMPTRLELVGQAPTSSSMLVAPPSPSPSVNGGRSVSGSQSPNYGGGNLTTTAMLATLRDLNEDGTRSFSDVCRALSGNARSFEDEWRSHNQMQTHSLSQLGAKMLAMTHLADEFAQTVTPIAVKIVEERNAPPSAKIYKPLSLPNYDGVFVIHGNVFVLSETPARVALLGGREAAHRAALNELRAVRTAIGAPFLGVRTPLCCAVSHMGFTVFVSAPISLPFNCSRNGIVYGCFSPDAVFAEPIGTYNAFKLAEFVPLMKHNPPSTASETTPAVANTASGGAASTPKQLYTAADVKQFYMKEDGVTLLLDAARWMPPAVCAAEFAKSKSRDDGVGSKVVSRHPLEDERTAHLTVLFRPEFMRNSCVVSLNGDAGAPSQPLSHQETIGFAIHNVLSVQVPLLTAELMHLFVNGELEAKDLSRTFHRFGVNLRYLGRVHAEVDYVPIEKSAATTNIKAADVRDALKHLLALEAAARTWKSLLRDEMAEVIRVKGEEQVAVLRMQHLLMTAGVDSEVFWENQMKERMELKFGFFVRPVVAVRDATDSGETVAAKVDPNSLKVYHAVRNTKIVVEATPEAYQWKPTPSGKFTVDPQSIASNHESETSARNVFPLLGPNARENAALFHRAVQLTGIEMTSDIRGKKINVVFRPDVKACTPLVISPAVQALLQQCPSSVQETVTNRRDAVELCDAVEAAAKMEVAAMMRHSETDPRATLPLRLLGMAQIGKGMLPQAYQTLSRWYELRKTLQLDLIIGYSAIDIAPLFVRARRADRGESLLVDGLKALRFGNEGVDLPSFCDALFAAASLVDEILWSESQRPPSERVARVLEYYHYACVVAEQMKHPLLPFIIEHIATLRRKYADVMTCASCGSSATVVSHQHDTDTAESKLRDREIISNTGSRTTAQTAAQQRRQLQQQQQRRRRGLEDKKEEESVADLFTKATLSPISQLYLDRVPHLPEDDTRVMLTGLLQGVAKPHVVARLARYMCDKCAPTGPADSEPIQIDTVRLYKRVVSLWEKLHPIQALGDATLGNTLVALGVLQGDGDVVNAGIHRLIDIYGATSRQVINAELQLADVLIHRSAIVCRYTGPGRDIQSLAQAEAVLHRIFDKIFAAPDLHERHSHELASVVRSMQHIIEIYSQQPVAKREHQALHYLVEKLTTNLGETHHLVGAALGQIKSYYVTLATLRRDDSVASSTALQTAGQFAVQWLRCRVASEDAADDIESHLSVIRDDIIKVLRAGGPQERQAATDIAASCQQIVQGSQYATNEQVQGAMRSIDDAFKTQLKVMEQSERTERVIQRIDNLQKEMVHCIANIKKHANGTDRYARGQVARMAELRDRALKLAEDAKDANVMARAQHLAQLHDDLLFIKPVPPQQPGSQGQPGGAASSSTPTTRGQQQSERQLGNVGESNSAQCGVAGGAASAVSKSRVYVSPYAFLGTGEKQDDVVLLDPVDVISPASRGATVGGGYGRSRRNRDSTSGAIGGSGSGPSPSAIAAFATLSEQSGRSKQTTEQLTRLFPRLAATAGKRNFSRLGAQ